MSYTYQARVLQRGTQTISAITVEALSKREAQTQLEAGGFVVLSLTAPVGRLNWLAGIAASTQKQFPLLCRELRTLIRAGMTVVEAVDTLAHKSRTQGHTANLPVQLLASLERGQSLSRALTDLPGAPPVLVAAVRAGERTSNLAEALDDYLKFDDLVQQLKRKVISASIYPALVVALGLGISLFLLIAVMPNFARMYENLRGSATGSTALMIDISRWVNAHHTEVLLGLAAATAAGLWWVQSGRALVTLRTWAMAVPWLRERVQDFQLAMIYQALALLLKGGYPLPQAMAIAAESALSPSLRQALTEARQRIERGSSVAQALSEQGLCDEVGRRLMAASERNGGFYNAADVVSRLHGERFELFVERLTRLVEPLLLLAVALMVGAIVVAMYLPVFDMATRLR
jgi:general secretion pathway protein F